MNGLGEKTFKQLWRELSNEGWKARKPTSIDKDHRYVKLNIKGRLDDLRRGTDFFVGEEELMAFGRRLDILLLAARSATSTSRPPTGKEASYTAVGRQPPTDSVIVVAKPSRPAAPSVSFKPK